MRTDTPTPSSTQPLRGVRVLALEQVLAAPFATQLLQRMGAEVVKIEPLTGELGRFAQPVFTDARGHDVSWTFARNSLGKSSVAIDLKTPEGRQLVLDLVPNFDLVVENMRGGAMKRLGLGYEELSAVNAQLVYVAVSGFGHTLPSPYLDRPAYGPVVEAMAGLYSLGAEPGERPEVGQTTFIADLFAGFYAVVGALAALRRRDVTGHGELVDVSLFDSALALNEAYATLHSMGAPTRLATGRGVGLFTAFAAKDGFFVVAAPREHQFHPLAEVVGHPEWVGDARLASRTDWEARCPDIIRPGVEAWARDKTRAEVVRILSAAGVPAGPVNTMDDLVDDEHVSSHEMFVHVARQEGPPALVAGTPIKFGGQNGPMADSLPSLGQDTASVLSNELGLTNQRLQQLDTQGTIRLA